MDESSVTTTPPNTQGIPPDTAKVPEVTALYLGTRISRTILFWAAFVLTRPLGTVVGDFLDKPLSAGGLALSRYLASGVLLLFIAVCLVVVPQRPAREAH